MDELVGGIFLCAASAGSFRLVCDTGNDKPSVYAECHPWEPPANGPRWQYRPPDLHHLAGSTSRMRDGFHTGRVELVASTHLSCALGPKGPGVALREDSER